MKATVQDLITLLQGVEDKSLRVVLEGCDCYGDFGGTYKIMNHTSPVEEYDYLLLERSSDDDDG